MPQEFIILKCFSCSMFQVHQIRKSKTWKCKLCNEKQSQQKIYGQGAGKECRIMVQQLNMKKKDKENDNVEENSDSNDGARQDEQPGIATERIESPSRNTSKWHTFKTGASLKENDSLSSDDERPMTEYDIKNIFKNATLDTDEWSGTKRRKLHGKVTKQRQHDNDFALKQMTTSDARDENDIKRINRSVIVPNFSQKPDFACKKRNYISTTVPVQKEESVIKNHVSSKWSKFGTSNQGDSSSDDNDIQ